MDWDVFISHAWEDKEAVARPLAKALEREGLRVWYDEFTLRVGDSLRRSIDHGLANSRYGVVILSPNFFAKEWPQKELDGLAAREVSGEKVILPVWHNITADQVREYSPTLADRVAVLSDRGLEHVVEELLRVIRPASKPARRLRSENDKHGIQYGPEVAQILSHYEGKRIKANREDKPNQYFVHKGVLHHLDVEAARVCDKRIGPFEDLDSNEEFILDIKEIKGSPYDRLQMIEVLDRIEAEKPRQPLKEKILTALRDPMWQMVGVVVAVITLGWGVYTFYTAGDGSGPTTPSPSPTQTATTVALPTPTSSPTHTPVTSTATPTNTPLPPTVTPTLTPTLTDTPMPLSPTDTPMPAPPPAVAEAGQVWVSPIDGAEMVYVSAGEFTMGLSDAQLNSALVLCSEDFGNCERNVFEDEQPQHAVYVNAFYIDKTEVTNERFARFVAETDYRTEAERQGWGWVWKGLSEGEKVKGADWRHPHGPGSNIEDKMDYPAVLISWNDADAYCQWAGKRLPTEAEWEKAARGTDMRIFPWGDTLTEGNRANFCDARCTYDWRYAGADDGYEWTAPVGSYPAGVSPYGVLDMAGNVWEWVADWYDPGYYSQSSWSNPSGPDYGGKRVLRGGSWFNIRLDLRCTSRHGTSPNLTFNDIGFRCAQSPQ